MGTALLVASSFLDPSRKKRTRSSSERKSPPTSGIKCARRLVIETFIDAIVILTLVVAMITRSINEL